MRETQCHLRICPKISCGKGRKQSLEVERWEERQSKSYHRIQGRVLRVASCTEQTYLGEKPNCPLMYVPKPCNSIATKLSPPPSPPGPAQQFFFLLLKREWIESSETEATFSEILKQQGRNIHSSQKCSDHENKVQGPMIWYNGLTNNSERWLK